MQMKSQFIGKGTTCITKKEFDEVPNLVSHELPNTDMYEAVLQFKFMDMFGNWQLVNVIHVKNDDEVERGVNFLCTKIEIEG
jgi:hypothetical protein